MSDELKDRYRKIIEQDCRKCTQYRPTEPKKNCPVCRRLLMEMQPDLVAQERLFVYKGMCNGFDWNGKD